MDKIIVIIGPTASGKSDLAVYLAEKFNGEVVSADSRQVYKGLDIGSGKITLDEMLDIPHHLLDVTNPKETFTVSDYQKLALKAIDRIVKKGKVPIIAGGSGFYIDSILYKQKFPNVPPNEKLREKLENLSTSQLFEKLQALDPARAETIDSKNRRRLVRALEIVQALGLVPESKMTENFKALVIEIDIKEEKLKDNIKNRLQKRLDEGMIEEVKRLHQEGLSWQKLEDFGLEYRYIAEFLQNKITKEEMINLIEVKSRQFAKRQRTWFKQYKNKHLISTKKEAEQLAKKFIG